MIAEINLFEDLRKKKGDIYYRQSITWLSLEIPKGLRDNSFSH